MLDALRRRVKIQLGHFPRNTNGSIVASSCTFADPDRLSLGRYVHIGPECFIDCKGGVHIDDGTILSSRVVILSSNHDYRSLESVPYGGPDTMSPVSVGKAVWIGYGAIILPGVHLGDGAIVGAGAVVPKSVAPGMIVAGNPARNIGERAGVEWRGLLADERYRLRVKASRQVP